MSNTPSPTPSEDNRRNIRNETAKLTIDRAMNTAEQSREDLLNSFTFLKKGDVDKRSKKSSSTDQKDEMMKIMSSILQKDNKSRQPDVKNRSLDKLRSKGTSSNGSTETPLKVDCDGIEEEVLDCGNASSRLSAAKIVKTGSHLKVDNFVEDEELGDDMMDQTGGYSASFQEEQCKTQSSLSSKTLSVETGPDTSDFASSLSMDENSTDKLLLNFLADLQNEKNAQKSKRTGSNSEVHVVSTVTNDVTYSSENDIDSFIKKNKRKEVVVDFSSDDDDATMSLVDNTNATNVKVIVKHDDLDEINKECLGDDIPLKSTKIVMDSEGNMCGDTNNIENKDGDKTVSNIVFPGEIVSEENVTEETSTCLANERLLDFKAIYKKSTDTDVSNLDKESVEGSTDDVEPFKLDPDFDYDNVVLTPKYSEADMERLQALFQMKTVIM